MPSMFVRNSLAAGGTVNNVLAGETFEFLKALSRVDVAMVCDATDGDLVTTIQFGPEVQAQDYPVMAEPGTGIGPLIPDHVIISDAAAAGDRLRISLRNDDAAATIVSRTLVRIRPIG